MQKEEIEELLREQTSSFAGRVWRAMAKRVGKPVPDAMKLGVTEREGRWNRDGQHAAYSSLDAATATAEKADQVGQGGPLGVQLEVYTIDIVLSRVVDLSTPDLLARGGVTGEDVRALEFGACHELAQTVADGGAAGIFVPSRVDPSGVNLVVFVDNLAGGDTMRVTGVQDAGDPRHVGGLGVCPWSGHVRCRCEGMGW